MDTSCSSGPHCFVEGSFLITTLSKPRLQGSELRLQQHLRWVTLRWDQEPLQGMLGRHLRRQLFQQVLDLHPDIYIRHNATYRTSSNITQCYPVIVLLSLV